MKLQLLLFFLFFIFICNGQEDKHSVYLIGNTYDYDSQVYNELEKALSNEKGAVSLLFLGDIADKKGIQKKITTAQKERLQALAKLAKAKNIKPFFLSGDRDWGNSGKKGSKQVKYLEDYIEKELGLKKAFIPNDGCPGPKVVALNDFTTLIAINSQWVLHPHHRPEAPETACKILSEADFWDELEDAIEDANGKNIILAAHHPIYSNGQYAGKRLDRYHLLPLVGSFYTSYRRQNGKASDMASRRYQHFLHEMQSILSNHSSILCVSGHEENMEALQVGENYFINSGAISNAKPIGKSKETFFRSKQKGFIKLVLAKDGTVTMTASEADRQTKEHNFGLLQSPCSEIISEMPSNTNYNPCQKKTDLVKTMNTAFRDSTTMAVAGPEYAAGKARIRWMGEHYRKEWTTSVAVNYLDLDTTFDGLTPFAKGGGLQTHSLKFKAGDGREYVFRAVDKDPAKALSSQIKQTAYRHIVKDLISTQHPYGGLVAAKLLDATDILHAQPQLFILPDDPKLDIYQKDFGNIFGTLEIRPKSPKNNNAGFGDADKVVQSNKMFRAFYKDHDNQIDKTSYTHARVFDMLVGDWDRHEDNWKWAAYKNGKKTYYKPIPRDRDHVFSQWEGIIPSIADKVIPNAENFGEHFNSIKNLCFKARHLDRQLGAAITLDEWLAAVTYIQSKITDRVIADAINEWPENIRAISGDEIKHKLQIRREELSAAVTTLYLQLAEKVDVVGSNKREIFDVERLKNGDVSVKMYDFEKETGERGELLYDRLLKKEETKTIRLYGLGGKDQFFVKGEVENSISLRIIGGKGADIIEDSSKVSGLKHYTRVYDSKRKDNITSSSETRIFRPAHPAIYNNKAFEYDGLAPIPKFRISSGNGFGAELVLNYTKQGFNKPDFAQKFQAKFIYYTFEASRLDLKHWTRHVLGKWDLLLHGRFSSLYDKFPFYYGLGNATERDDELFEDDYYRTDFNTIRFYPALVRKFLAKSKISIGLAYEYNNVNARKDDASIFFEPKESTLNGVGKQHLGGMQTIFNLDFRDNPIFSQYGSQLFINHTIYNNLSRENDIFGKIEGHIAHYYTVQTLLPITFAGRAAYSQTYGEVPFYHLSALGSNTYLRAYYRNRFLGKRAAFFNSEVRFHFGTIRTPLVPFKWGIFGFADWARTWFNAETDADKFYNSYGAGLYIAPLDEILNFIFYLAHSEDEDVYFKIGLGFDLQ